TPACIPFLLVAQALGAHLASISRGRSPAPEAVFSSGFLHLDNMRFGIFRGSHPPRKTRRQFEYPDISAYVKQIMQPKNQFGNFSHHEMNREWKISKNAGRSH
ncbi:hypothetical protein, partial [Burkholderia gladioli]|uniref:hypothetical protein n=1 Tax=Burkholderia gladioli TaxID=28095 RepID=UPI001ABB19E4